MRISLLLALLLLVGCGDATTAADSPEDAARIVVEALRANDFALCESIIPNADDMRWMTEAIRAANNPKARKMLERLDRDGPETSLRKVRDHVRKSFERLCKEGREEKIDWAEVRFDRLHKVQRTTLGEIEALRFYIRLHLGDKPGEIRVTSLMRVPRGWILTDELKS